MNQSNQVADKCLTNIRRVLAGEIKQINWDVSEKLKIMKGKSICISTVDERGATHEIEITGVDTDPLIELIKRLLEHRKTLLQATLDGVE